MKRKPQKKHLSQIVSGRILATLLGSFLALMAVMFVLVFFYATGKTEDFVRYSLEEINRIVSKRLDWNMQNGTIIVAEYIDSKISESTSDVFPADEINERLEYSVEMNANSEWDLVDPDGIIVASSADENIGFDMHSGSQSEELLCLLDGSCTVYTQEMMPRSMDGVLMKYTGARLPEYGGILLDGFNEEDYDYLRETSFAVQSKNSKVGRTGYYLYLNNRFEIMSSPEPYPEGEVLTLSRDIRELAENGMVVNENVYGTSSYVGVLADDEEYIVAVYPAAEAWASWSITILALILIYTAAFIILFLMIRYLTQRHVGKGVYSLNDSLAAITDGDLEKRADFRESIEFDELSGGINATVDRLKELIREAEGRIDAELAFAAKIQSSSLPHVFPPFPDRKEFDLYACMVPAKEVGGDFYDFFFTDRDHLALIMADVSGKGLPAAMFMLMAKDRLRHSVQKHGSDVAEAVREVNLALIKENDAGLFVTVWLGVIDVSTGHLDYVNAGHEYPAICHAGGEFTAGMDVHCPPVATRKKAKFEAGSLELHAGDVLYLYTDGVTEANDPKGEMFRRTRMLAALNTKKDAPVEEIDAAVRTAIAEFAGNAPQFDDTTTLCFRYKK